MFIAALALSIISFASQGQLDSQASLMAPKLPAKLARPETIIKFSRDIDGSIYDVLLGLAVGNRVPLGIVRDRATENGACGLKISIKAGDLTLAALTKTLNEQMSDREAVIADGVLLFRPKKISRGTEAFLRIRIPEFHSNLANHNAAGVSLWFYIRSVIAPGEATAYAGGAGFSSEKMTIPPSIAHTVQQNLDLIITQGLGGAWVLESSGIAEPLREVRKPYFVYDYNGDEEGLQHALRCHP